MAAYFCKRPNAKSVLLIVQTAPRSGHVGPTKLEDAKINASTTIAGKNGLA